MPLLQFQEVQRTYTLGDEKWTLGPLTFAVEKGEEIALIGASGSGKSTLLHMAGALDTISSGAIYFQENSLADMSERQLLDYRNQHIGFVFQDFYLLPEFTLLENVAMPLSIAGVSARSRKEKAEYILQKVGLYQKRKHLPKELSGGQRQRAAIARALIHTPELLLADEPTGNLDSKTGQEIIDLLRSLHKEYTMTFLIVTHDDHIAALMERTITLEDGKIVSDTKKK